MAAHSAEYVVIGRRHPNVELILHTVAQCKRWGHDQYTCEDVYARCELEATIAEWRQIDGQVS
jgi:hypothetical protein